MFQKNQKTIERYYIYGELLLRTHQGGLLDQVIKYIYSAADIEKAWPQNKEVQIFRTEQDVLDYCKGKRISHTHHSPIFLVECEKIEDSKWVSTEITFNYTKYQRKERSSNKEHYSSTEHAITRSIDIATVAASSLKPISGEMRAYGVDGDTRDDNEVPKSKLIGVTRFEEQVENTSGCTLF